jgi:hypothetical protein
VREPPIILVRRAGALNSRRAAAKDSGPSASWLETASLIAAMLAFMPGAFEPDDRTGGLGERRDEASSGAPGQSAFSLQGNSSPKERQQRSAARNKRSPLCDKFSSRLKRFGLPVVDDENGRCNPRN